MIASGLRRSAKAGLLAAGWYERHIAAASFPGVLVLCYHGIRTREWRADEPAFADLHVDARTFEDHCEVVAGMCHPISLDDWRAASNGRTSLPPRPVLVTFDDGYRSVYAVARPILKRKGIPAVVFVCTEPVRTQRLFWFDAAARGDDTGTCVDTDPLAPMTIEQVRALSSDGFEIGAHTATHPALSRQSPSDQQLEIRACSQALTEWIGRAPRALAYPFGKPDEDYSAAAVQIAGECGFDAAFTTRADFARPDEHPLERSRFVVLSEVSGAELAHRIAHSWPR